VLSVTARLILRDVSEAVSVRRIREAGSASDLDILVRGVLRDITRFVGAERGELVGVDEGKGVSELKSSRGGIRVSGSEKVIVTQIVRVVQRERKEEKGRVTQGGNAHKGVT